MAELKSVKTTVKENTQPQNDKRDSIIQENKEIVFPSWEAIQTGLSGTILWP